MNGAERTSAAAGSASPNFRAIFEASPGLILVLAPDLSVIAASDARLEAARRKREDILGKDLFQALAGDPLEPGSSGALDLLRMSLARVRETRVADTTPIQLELVARPESDGGGVEQRCWRVVNAPVLSASGDLVYIIHQIEDVTETVRLQQRAAERLAELGREQATVEQFFSLSLDLLCITGSDGYFRRLNPAFARLGYTQEELLSRPFIDLVHPEDRAAISAEIAKLAAGAPTASFESRARCKDGSYRWFVWNAAPDATGTLYGVAHDVTDRKRIEEARRQANLFLEAVVENIPHMVFVKDAERLAFVRFNRAGEELLGVSRSDLLGKNDYDLFPAEEADFFQAKDRETLEASVLVDIPEETIQTKSGPRLLHTKKVPIVDDEGKPLYLLGISEDITERRAAEDAVARLAAIIESSDDAIISETLEGIVTSWNRGAEKVFGYTADETLGQPMSRFTQPEREDERAQILKRLLANERVDHFETTRRRKDGRKIDVSVSLSLLKDTSGRVIGVSKIARDISAAKRAAAERQSLETRATTVLDTVQDGIVVIDEVGTVSTFNRGAERIFGYTASEIVGRNVDVLMPHHGLYDGDEVVGARKDGSRVPLELSLTEMQVDGKRCYTGLLRDITERKAAEAALAKKNQELEVAARIDRIGARVMIALSQQDESTNPAGEVLRVLAEEAGYRPLAFYDYDEWQGGLVLGAGLSLGPSYDRKRLRVGEGLVGEAAAQRQPVFVDGSSNAPFSLDTGVGILTAASLFAIPLVHREKVLGVIAGAAQTVLLDRERSWLAQVASQVAIGLHANRQFQELKSLSEQLNERSRKIEAQNRELAHASRLKSEFLASMSHELRTPLNAIIGFSEALKDGLLGELPPAQLEYTTEIFQSGRHLLSLINDILDLSKIEAGKMDLHVEPLEVASLVSNALTIMKERAAKGRVTVTQSIAPGITTLDADGRKVRQIIYNLLSNAVKFTPQGGTVRVEVTRVEDDVEFAVVDSGIGIASHERPRLFQSFEQLEGGIARRFEGTGLGLVMVKNLVELHGGTCGVESELGKGSRFWVRLPFTRSDARSVSGDGPPPAERAANPSQILVVNDDLVTRDLLRLYLEDAGFVVTAAENAEAALRKLGPRRPDLIVLDLAMADRSACDFLAACGETAPLKGVPVVVVSAPENLQKALAVGAQAVLTKPIRRHEFLEVVRRLLDELGHDRPYVLVVDDDPKAVEIVSSYFADEPVEVGRAYGGRAALELVRERRPDLVILDLMMPDVSGLDVLSELRDRADTAELPVVILTAKELTTSERSALAQHAQAVFGKPTTARGDLLNQARRLLGEGARAAGAKRVSR